MRLNGSGMVDPVSEAVRGRLTMELTQPLTIPELPAQLSGGGTMDIDLSGTMEKPGVSGEIRVKDLLLGEHVRGDGVLSVDVQNVLHRPNGELSISLDTWSHGWFELESGVDF